ncbi:MAG: ThiF family adenylyltransferase [Candidatus Binatia bacterium]
MNTLIFPFPIFQRLLRTLAQDPHRIAFARVGTYHTPSVHEWFVREVVLSPSDTIPSQGPLFRIALTTHPQQQSSIQQSLAAFPPTVVGRLDLGTGPLRAYLWGSVSVENALEPLHRLSLVGAGMHVISVAPWSKAHVVSALPAPVSSFARWSRMIGALGGEEVWQRLVRLCIALIGCGRTGSLVAATLARVGVHALTLIDPDLVEEHNLGEMDMVTLADVGRPKTQALAAHLSRAHESPDNFAPATAVASSIHSIPTSVTAASALAACNAAQVLFCCVDTDTARFATALIATL